MLEYDDVKGIFRKEDIPHSDLKLVADTCGEEVAIRLLLSMSGMVISIPKFLHKAMIVKFIIENRNRFSPKELVLKTGMSERFVYETLNSTKPQEPPTLEMFG